MSTPYLLAVGVRVPPPRHPRLQDEDRECPRRPGLLDRDGMLRDRVGSPILDPGCLIPPMQTRSIECLDPLKTLKIPILPKAATSSTDRLISTTQQARHRGRRRPPKDDLQGACLYLFGSQWPAIFGCRLSDQTRLILHHDRRACQEIRNSGAMSDCGNTAGGPTNSQALPPAAFGS